VTRKNTEIHHFDVSELNNTQAQFLLFHYSQSKIAYLTNTTAWLQVWYCFCYCRSINIQLL